MAKQFFTDPYWQFRGTRAEWRITTPEDRRTAREMNRNPQRARRTSIAAEEAASEA